MTYTLVIIFYYTNLKDVERFLRDLKKYCTTKITIIMYKKTSKLLYILKNITSL